MNILITIIILLVIMFVVKRVVVIIDAKNTERYIVNTTYEQFTKEIKGRRPCREALNTKMLIADLGKQSSDEKGIYKKLKSYYTRKVK